MNLQCDFKEEEMVPGAGVKALVDNGISVVPGEYVRFPKGLEYDEDEELPVVDLSGIETDESKRRLVADAVHRACQEWGFFQLVGHGVPVELMQSMSELVHYFFNMPAEERMLYYSEDRLKTFKFGTSFNPAVDKTKCWRDYLYQRCKPPPRDEELPNIPRYREITNDYSKAIDALAKRLLGIFTECLGLEPGALENRLGIPPRHTMRMNFYPPCPNPELAVGLDGHSDPVGFTILQQDDGVEGLQVLHKERWVTVKPRHGAFVINIADQIQILTNEKYKSVEHRAIVNATKTRVSVASFISPGFDMHIAPMDELLAGDVPLYGGCKYGDYLGSFESNVLDSKTALDPLKILPRVR